ncbi:MAG: Hpt domain-containing protein [Promethearchaeota archaeon]
MEFQAEVINTFIDEAGEHLDKIETDTLSLEKQNSNPDMKLVNNMFRGFHSIKGASLFLDFKDIAELSHILENMLDDLRSGTIKPDSDFIDTILDGVDKLREFLFEIDQN